MIQLIVRLGKWLESRFPEKVYIRAEEYIEFKEKLSLVAEQQKHIDVILQRLSVVEKSAVHTEAVKVLIGEIQKLKEDFTTIKTGLGLARIQDTEIQAMLNGIPITPEDPSNV